MNHKGLGQIPISSAGQIAFSRTDMLCAEYHIEPLELDILYGLIFYNLDISGIAWGQVALTVLPFSHASTDVQLPHPYLPA